MHESADARSILLFYYKFPQESNPNRGNSEKERTNLKVIDEKGKLFGKVNLIDLLVVLVLIAVAAGVFWKIAGDDVTDVLAPSSKTTLEYEVLCTAVWNDVCTYASGHVGGQLMSNGDLLDGYVTGCTVEPYITTSVDSDGNTVAVTDQARSNLRFTISVSLAPSDKNNSVGSQEVRVGKNHIVKTGDLEITGTVTKVANVNG